MVDHFDFEKLTGADDVARGPDVGFGRGRIAAGMIMDQNDGGGVCGDSASEHFARVHEDLVQNALRDFFNAN